MTIPDILVDILISGLIVIGSGFALIGSWGMVRLPTLMERLHGPTKATTLGLGGVLVGSMLFFQIDQGTWALHELLISLFLFITAPISANMIAKVHLHALRAKGGKSEAGPAGLPPAPSGPAFSGPAPSGNAPSGNANWATYEAPHKDSVAATSDK